MGIRFQCEHCQYPLHLKSELAGRRGVCPECKGKFRIPSESLATTDSSVSSSVATSEQRESSHTEFKSRAPADLPRSENTVPVAVVNDNDCFWVAPPSGGRYGPADKKLLTEWAKQNRITADSLLYAVPRNQTPPSQSNHSVAGIRADILLKDVFNTAPRDPVANFIDPLNLSQATTVPQSGRINPIAAAKNKRKRRRNFQIVLLCGMLAVVAVLCVVLWTIMNRPAKATVVHAPLKTASFKLQTFD